MRAHHHLRVTPLAKVGDAAVKAVGLTTAEAARDFYRAEEDRTVTAAA